jgi:hypothetical protein
VTNDVSTPTYPDCEVELIGTDSNAFAILGNCKDAFQRYCRDNDLDFRSLWNPIRDEMLAGDYDHLLQTAMKHFEVS